MRILRNIGILLPVLALQGCPGGYGYKYGTGTFPTQPVNFTEINTEFDDYNASAPNLGETFPLCFSSTRNSRGEDFDLVYKLITISFSKTTGELSINDENSNNYDVVSQNSTLVNAMRKVNTTFDEFGPYLSFNEDLNYESNERYYGYYLLYSNDEDGTQDIRFTHNLNSIQFEDPLPVGFLNSDADDAYPCFNSDHSALYFCSNRDQNFDIYKALTDSETSMVELLASEEAHPIEKDSILSSAWDDKCPYIAYNGFYENYYPEEAENNMLVFASNREGGFGGFDLYYSKLVDGKWAPPQNFGAGINSEYDEYRPIVRPQYDFTNDFMLFSSNRPGGLGGFDLYYVGIPDIGYPIN